MGRIITFKAPAYHATSRATSPVDENDSDIDPICSPCTLRPDSPMYDGKSMRPALKNSKSVSFSDDPPVICEVPHWDRTPMIPTTEDVVNATDSDTDEEAPSSRRQNGATSLEQATRWARRLSM